MQNPLRIAPGIVAGLAAATLGFGSVADLAAAAAVLAAGLAVATLGFGSVADLAAAAAALAAAARAVGTRRRDGRSLEAAAVPLAAGPSLACVAGTGGASACCPCATSA
jgi:hypothetical protein